MGDVTLLERIILSMDPPCPQGDVNEAGAIDMWDVISLERTILGLD